MHLGLGLGGGSVCWVQNLLGLCRVALWYGARLLLDETCPFGYRGLLSLGDLGGCRSGASHSPVVATPHEVVNESTRWLLISLLDCRSK